MASIKNFGLMGVGSDVQFGKAGPRLVNSNGAFRFRTSDNQAFARLEIAEPNANSDAATKFYVDNAVSAVQNELDLTQASTGLDASGSLVAWSSTNFIAAATTIAGGINALDAALKSEETARIAGDASLAGRALAAEGRLDSAETTLGSHGLRLGSLEARMTSAEGDIGTLYDMLESGTGALQAELDLTQVSVGLSTSGSYVAPVASNYLGATTTVMGALGALDTAIFNVDGNLSAVEGAVGLGADGSLGAWANASYIALATTVKAGVEALDAALASAVNARTQRDAELQTEIDNVETALATETAARIAGDASLTTAIANEAAARVSAIQGVTTLINDETAARASADASLVANIASIAASYINKDGSVAFTADQSMNGFKLTNVGAPTANGDAVNKAYLDQQVGALGSAFNYVGLIAGGADVGTATNMSSQIENDIGDYYKVSTPGYFVAGTYAAIFANTGDGIVFNTAGGIDKIDNTDTVVRGSVAFIEVTGSADTGFDIDIDDAFKGRMDDAETDITGLRTDLTAETAAREAGDATLQVQINQVAANLASEATARLNGDNLLQGEIDLVEADLAAEVTNRTNADNALGTRIDNLDAELGSVEASLTSAIASVSGSVVALTSFVNAEFAAVDTRLDAHDVTLADHETRITDLEQDAAASNASLEARIGSAEARITTAEGSIVALTSDAAAALSAASLALTTAINSVDSNLTAVEETVGLTSAGAMPVGAFTGSYVAGAHTSVIAAINSMGDAAGAALEAERVARAAADAALQAELDLTQASVGLPTDGGAPVWATSAPTYVTSAATIKAAIEGTATALANLSQDEIRNATGDVRVKTATSAIQMSVPGASGATTAVEVVGGASMDTSMVLDFGTSGDIRFEAAGSGADVNFRFVPKGTGQVFIGDAGVAGAVQADVGQDLILAGGNNTGANAAGSLRLRPGDSASGADGAVRVEAPAGGGTYTPVMLFNSTSAATYFEVTAGASSATLAAAGGANASIVLAPTGTGTVDASSKRITSVANPTLDTDAVNKGFMNTAISTAVATASAGAVTTRVGTVSNDGTVNLGTAMTGTVLRVKVLVTAAFSAGSLSVGRSGDTAELAANADIDLTQTGLYIVENAVDYSSTQVLATASGLAGGGSAKVIVEFLQG